MPLPCPVARETWSKAALLPALALAIALAACGEPDPAVPGDGAVSDAPRTDASDGGTLSDKPATLPGDAAETGSAPADTAAPEVSHDAPVLADTADGGAPDATSDAAADAISDATGDAGTDVAAGPRPRDTTPAKVRFDFENGTQEWKDIRFDFFGQTTPVAVESLSDFAYEGAHSLKLAITTRPGYDNPTVGIQRVFDAELAAGTVITYWVWIPADGSLDGVQPFTIYFKQGAGPDWSGNKVYMKDELQPGQWNELTHRLPDDLVAPGVVELGLELRTVGPGVTTTVYVDDVHF
jgi:hypothetical protein